MSRVRSPAVEAVSTATGVGEARTQGFEVRVEALARVCVPALTARMAGMAARYEELARRLADGKRLDAAALRALEEEEELGPELGYVLGVLAAARGTDVLRVRRSANGARTLVGLLAETLGTTLRPGAEELPDVTAGDGGWEAALSLGLCFHACACERRSLAWELQPVEGAWCLRFPERASDGALAAAVKTLESLGVRAAGEAALLPASWLAAPAGPRDVEPRDRPDDGP